MQEYRFVDPYDNLRVLKPRGHYLLVRRCKMPGSTFLVGEPRFDVLVPFRREGQETSDLADAAEKSLSEKILNPICKVLAVGPDVGKPRSKKELRRLRLVEIDEKGREYVKDQRFVGREGDFVGLPESAGSGRMFRGVTGYEYDILVDEGELQGAYIPAEKAA